MPTAKSQILDRRQAFDKYAHRTKLVPAEVFLAIFKCLFEFETHLTPQGEKILETITR